ncbi:hypothetical protein BK816_08000 [Boudabousia tangfeifanii]|uniref:ACT domain-containing protein n=1 Tax=Boudabousia tangfeifanii TaxID=1912795 RepID=A0A1D9MLT2_9ACTO|nr:hypothetical protein [Boudabousia tangfeifanii]AOZ73235.1 hypothetical protein BK816_08000 [Boudabousia tangfeifanii]
MRNILVRASALGFTASVNSSSAIETEDGKGMRVVMHFEGLSSFKELESELRKIEGVFAVDTVNLNHLE